MAKAAASETVPTFVHVTTPTLVYVGIADRDEFDRINLPCPRTDTGRVLVKMLGNLDGQNVTVVFQHFPSGVF